MKFNRKKIAFYGVIMFCIWMFFYISVPLMVKEHQKNKILNEIELIKNKIEYNKQQRLNCSTNMELWNSENEQNRKLVEELSAKYNQIAGF